MNYRIFLIFIFLFLSACASTKHSAIPLSPVAQQEILLTNLQNAGVRRVQVGDELRLVLPNQRFFIKNTAQLKVDVYPILDQLVTLLNEQKNLGIEVLAYTPSEDLQEETTGLGKQQAVAIEEYLLDQGLNTRIIVAKAWDRNDQNNNRGVRFAGDQPQICTVEVRTRYLHAEDSE